MTYEYEANVNGSLAKGMAELAPRKRVCEKRNE